MGRASRLKGGGYLASIASVVLLGIPAMDSAGEDRLLLFSLLAGMVLSVAGIVLRWRSHCVERQEKHEQESKLDAAGSGLRARGSS